MNRLIKRPYVHNYNREIVWEVREVAKGAYTHILKRMQ